MPRSLKVKLREKEAKRLINLRKKLELTQRDLAHQFNVSHGAIAHWEGRKRTIPGSVLKLIGLYEKERR